MNDQTLDLLSRVHATAVGIKNSDQLSRAGRPPKDPDQKAVSQFFRAIKKTLQKLPPCQRKSYLGSVKKLNSDLTDLLGNPWEQRAATRRLRHGPKKPPQLLVKLNEARKKAKAQWVDALVQALSTKVISPKKIKSKVAIRLLKNARPDIPEPAEDTMRKALRQIRHHSLI